MSERKKNSGGARLALVLALSAAVVCGTMLLIGAAASFAVVQGWMQMEQLKYAALAALWLAAMLGGIFLCVKTEGVPILCGMAVGGVQAVTFLIVGIAAFAAPIRAGILFCLLPSLLGGFVGGALCAMTRTAHHR